MTLQLLGGMTVKQFLSRHWQKRPLLVRQAIPDFKGIIQPHELLRLACRDDVEARIVSRDRNRWKLSKGPFARTDFARPPGRRWTVLVQGVNLHHAPADALLRRFSFLPYARLDDVMVSFASRGGGVGPHADSYDVFLLQGTGRRRWRVGKPQDLGLVRGAPLQILARFEPEREWILEPGDMLYLPPGHAHEGVALEECMTYSIGFRAPAARELASALLARLEDSLEQRMPPLRYSDPGLAPAAGPASIPAALDSFAKRVARSIRLRPGDVATALGEYLSEPKAQVVFEPPARPQARRRFLERARRRGIALDARSILLYRGTRFFINGESLGASGAERTLLLALADARALPRTPGSISDRLCNLLYQWYLAGWIVTGAPHGTDA
jgi:50S ribosomal protein L16 3-hydroxylase